MKNLSGNQQDTYNGRLLSRTSTTPLTLAVCWQVMEAVPSAFTVWVGGWITWKPGRRQRALTCTVNTHIVHNYSFFFSQQKKMNENNDNTLTCIQYKSIQIYCTSLIQHCSCHRIFFVFLIISSSSILTRRPLGCHLKWENIPWAGWGVKLVARTAMKMSSLSVAISVCLRSENFVRLSRRHMTAAGRQSCLWDRKQVVHKTNQPQSLVSVEASFAFAASTARTNWHPSQLLHLCG